MPTCHRCGNEYDVSELTRHEREGILVVHCPGCGCTLGTYNDHTH